jgi:cytochrome subunit of sulfide dehydrogenase
MRFHSAVSIAAIFVSITFSSTTHAQDTTAARALAATCFTCHGTNGVSVNNIPPSLAGQDKAHLLQLMREFRDGKRPATIMHQHAKGYTDTQLDLIAGYFAAQKR